MTSSMPAPRIDLGDDSPITQRIASSTLDLPQPLGPTTPVRPGSILSSAASTKLLNPESLRRFTCTFPLGGRSLSARRLKQRLDPCPDVGVGHLSVDDEGRRALDPGPLGRGVQLQQPLEPGLVGET